MRNCNPGRGFWVNFCKKCGECGEFFVRNAVIAVNALKISISPHFTAFLTKIHRKIHRISYKISPHRLLWQINVRNAVIAVKINISPHFLQKFTAKFTAFLTKIHRVCFPTFTQSDLSSRKI